MSELDPREQELVDYFKTLNFQLKDSVLDFMYVLYRFTNHKGVSQSWTAELIEKARDRIIKKKARSNAP